MALTLAQIQAMITNKEDSRQIINEITDYLEANPGGGGGVESVTAGTGISITGTATVPIINATGGSSYLALVTTLGQSATENPASSNFQNTIGATDWVRDGVGNYSNITTTAFDITKIWVGGSPISDSNATYIALFDNTAELIVMFALAFYEEAGGVLAIGLRVKGVAGVDTDISELVSTNLALPEIRIYP